MSTVIKEFCDKEFYKEDYYEITSYFATDVVAYEEVINYMRKLAESEVFENKYENEMYR